MTSVGVRPDPETSAPDRVSPAATSTPTSPRTRAEVPIPQRLRRRAVGTARRIALRLAPAGRRTTGGHPLFDVDWYVATYPEVASSPLAPWDHYRRHGRAAGHLPNAWLDPAFYRERYPDVAEARLDPIDHYLEHGWREGRDPGPAFSTDWYLETHPGLREGGVNPLAEFLAVGRGRGDIPSPDAEDVAIAAPTVSPARGRAAGGEARAAMLEDDERLVAAAVDHAIRVSDDGVLLIGWVFDPLAQVRAATLITDGRRSDDVLATAARVLRPDIDESYVSRTRGGRGARHGFVCLVRVSAKTRPDADVVLELALDDGSRWQLDPVLVRRDRGSPIDIVRDVAGLLPSVGDDAFHAHVAPAVDALIASDRSSARAEAIESIGTVSIRPATSVLVRLSGQSEALENQLAALGDDPDFGDGIELLLLADSEARAELAIRSLDRANVVTGLSGSVLVGTAASTPVRLLALGLQEARAATIVSLSDATLPIDRYWSRRLQAAIERDPTIGAVAPRLLHWDGSLHANAFAVDAERPERRPIELRRVGEGLPAPAASDGLEAVFALDGEALAIRREALEEVGGIDTGYLTPALAAADLCRRLAEHGQSVAVDGGTTLVHLDSNEHDGEDGWRTWAARYDQWRYRTRWASAVGTS